MSQTNRPEITKNIYTNLDLVQTTNIGNANEWNEIINKLKKELSEKELNSVFYILSQMIAETVHELYPQHKEDIEFYEKNTEKFWLKWLEKNSLTLIKFLNSESYLITPKLADLNQLFLSRLYPLLSEKEVQKMQNSKVLFLGASTGSLVALQLAELGLGNMTIVDPDKISVSNTNRIAYSSLMSVGQNKALHLAAKILETNPNINVTAYTERLEESELSKLIAEHDIVVEMTDSLPFKYLVRKIAKQLSAQQQKTKFVMMGTNVDEPLITIEELEDNYFLNEDLNADQIETIMSSQNPLEYIAGVINIIGKENIPARQMINFILIAKGKIKHMAQHGASASAAGYGVARSIQQIICGAEIANNKHQISVDEIFEKHSLEKLNQIYFEELKKRYPDVFGNFTQLSEAIETLFSELFGKSF